VTSWAPWLVTGRLKASARWQIFMKLVTPPQLVTSGSGQVTPPEAIRWRNSQSVRRFSPAAIGRPPSRDDPGMAGHVVGGDRLLEPGEIEGLKGAGRADRLIGRPFHVGVDHEREAVAEMLAHGGDPLDVLAQRSPGRPSS
jgi:hypothetical protein